MRRIERRIDVSGAAGLGEPIEMAATIFLPDPVALPDRPAAIFAALLWRRLHGWTRMLAESL